MGLWHTTGRGGRTRSRLAALAAGLVMAVAGLATSTPADAQIRNTKHNLGTTPGGTGVNQFSGTAEICVFCHTPHGADTSAAVPLWNRTLPAPARLLVVGTYPPVEAIGFGNPLRTLVRNLLARRRAVEIAVEPLSLRDVETYLSRLFDGTAMDPRLADAMHARTDGNPLFLVSIVEHLIEVSALAFTAGRWQLGQGLQSIEIEGPGVELRILEDIEEQSLVRVVGAERSTRGLEGDLVVGSAACVAARSTL